MDSPDFFFYLWLGMRVLFIGLLFIFVISGIDDLFLDLVYYARVIFRHLFRRKFIKRVSLEQLNTVPEKPVAIMVPAWHEYDVISRMLMNSVGTIDYKNFVIFLGTYPNDEPTRLEALKVREIYPNIEVVTTPQNGPTNKADCLNWIYQGILLYEKNHAMQFAIVMMHDSEDIIHPLSLKFCNYLVPRVDFIQIPVYPLETPWYDFISGVYKDEFAESHVKNMRAREVLASALPSAGVGTAMSRAAIEFLANKRRNQIFDIRSLTEDYLLGLSLADMPGKKIFLQQEVERRVKRRSFWTGKETVKVMGEPIATREFFPNTFAASTRQKARWVLGIGIQGWHAGWTHRLGDNYCLYRDRKGIPANLVIVVAYVVMVYWWVCWMISHHSSTVAIPPLVERDEIYSQLFFVVFVLLIWRLLNRALCTGLIYGPLDAALSLPRLLVSNVVNFWATILAIRRYINSRLTGKEPEWGKTAHAWPTESQMRNYHRKVGDLLLECRLINTEQLKSALEIQKRDGRKLGEVLVTMGVLTEADLKRVLSDQGTADAARTA